MPLKNRALTGLFLFSVVICNGFAAETDKSSQNSATKLNLEKIMADPDWMGNSPENPDWSPDSGTIYFQQKALGHRHRDILKLDLLSSKVSLLGKNDLLIHASAQAKLNSKKTQGVFAYQGDVYVVDFASQVFNPLTADARVQTNINFVNNTTISYMVGRQIFVYHLDTRLERQVADFKMTSDPEKEKDKDYLQQSQPRLLNYLHQKKQENQYQKTR